MPKAEVFLCLSEPFTALVDAIESGQNTPEITPLDAHILATLKEMQIHEH